MSLVLRASDVVVRLDPDDGCRMASLEVRGMELLGGAGNGTIEHGSFVMAPWAGRIRFGRLSFDGQDFQLPLRLPPHAAHGTVVDRPWAVDHVTESSARLSCGLDDPWPVHGRVTQEVTVDADSVTQSVIVETLGERFPASIGWHPWFRRRLDHGGPLEMAFTADGMLVRDDDDMPTDQRVDAGDGPWDDCFVGMRWPVRLRWPRALSMTVTADTDVAVLYNLRDAVWCVEPQTGPPNEPNAAPRWVTADQPLTATTTWAFAEG